MRLCLQSRQILQDDSLTRGLGDCEAQMLVEWVIDWIELIHDGIESDSIRERAIARVVRQARTIGRFVRYWHENDRLAAMQLAAVEQAHWPLPRAPQDPVALLRQILRWEDRHRPIA
ncbi:hypothetical protein [Tuwongella immobilis]|uniref:Uncharacterized protein n=1 Tax=Tuwongella immobilis TaxID=692036 RepID=A0A6C2YJE5_9BACT|nr:hypothetical protein [Tuwongella immobilis]VIP01688.1 unnamed protein product [Tuwongella immobilis]VTR99152.1 unnamed protein product [Tuwongella immobilis]